MRSVHRQPNKKKFLISHSLHLPKATTVDVDDTVHIIRGTTRFIIINRVVKNNRFNDLYSCCNTNSVGLFHSEKRTDSIQKQFPLTDQLVNTAADTYTVSETVPEGK